jgi:uncharacterized coiled-coil DUF342 family protein
MRTSPVNKVIQMLSDMLAKGKETKQDEQVEFAKYKQFCDSTRAEKSRNIQKAKDHITQLEADIESASSAARDAASEIASLDADITQWEEAEKKGTALRNQQHADFQKSHQDYSQSVEALARAKQTVKQAQGGSFTQIEPSLIQLSSKVKRMPERARRMITSFLQSGGSTLDEGAPLAGNNLFVLNDDNSAEPALLQDGAEAPGDQDFLTKGAPQPDAYDSQSGGILDMVDKLGDKFTEERTALENQEANSKHQYDMRTQELTDQIESATREREEKTQTKAKAEQTKAECEGDLADTKHMLDTEQKSFDHLSTECATKSRDFENRQTLRGGEISALEKALEILGGDKVKGSSDKHFGSAAAYVQDSSDQSYDPVSLAQLRTTMKTGSMGRVHTFLQERANQFNSQVLSMVAQSAAQSPFTKVSKMIKDLIVKLMEEANEEAEHKGWCDSELSTNKQTRDSKTDEADTLKAEVEQLTADIAKLTEEIGDLAKEVADLDSQIAKATEDRDAEKAKNEQTLMDSKNAQQAVAQALAVLKDFYAKAAEATSLAQEDADTESPQSFAQASQEPYTGQSSTGVIGMLEVIESDFARLESDTAAAESEADRAFTDFMTDSRKDKAVKITDSKHKASTKQAKESALASAKKDLRGTTEELEAAMTYYEKLKPSCVDAGQSYEERVQRRKEEIESLQEALKILAGEDIA